MADMNAWLVERHDPNNPSHVLAESFLGIAGQTNVGSKNGELTWMRRADDGLRFCRQQDAEMFIGMMQAIMEGLPHRETLPGLRSGDPRPISVEHSWP